jgi:hypothetical protein
MSRHLTYRYYSFYRVGAIVSFVGSVLVTFLIVSWPGVEGWFILVGISFFAWNAYMFLLRMSYEIEVDQGILFWKAPIRSGTVQLADVRAVRRSRLSWNVGVIQLSSGRPISVLVRKGFRDFCEALAAQQPELQLDIHGVGWLSEQLPWPRSGFSAD